jgi:hypothetical protein
VNRLRWFIHDQKVLAEKRMIRTWFRLPPGLRHTLVCSELGALTVLDPRLHRREVPTITIQEVTDAMRYERAAA